LAAATVLLLRSTSRNYPLDLKPLLERAGYSTVSLSGLDEFISCPKRGEPFLAILEVGSIEDIERALIAHEWSETVQPQVAARYLIFFASKNLSLGDRAMRFRSVETAHLPLPPKNLLFKVDLQARLLEAERHRAASREAQGFESAWEEKPGGKERVLVLRGPSPKRGTWQSGEDAPQGRVRWRWVTSEARSPAKESEANAPLAWVAEARSAPKYDEQRAAWVLEDAGASLQIHSRGKEIHRSGAKPGEGPPERKEKPGLGVSALIPPGLGEKERTGEVRAPSGTEEGLATREVREDLPEQEEPSLTLNPEENATPISSHREITPVHDYTKVYRLNEIHDRTEEGQRGLETKEHHRTRQGREWGSGSLAATRDAPTEVSKPDSPHGEEVAAAKTSSRNTNPVATPSETAPVPPSVATKPPMAQSSGPTPGEPHGSPVSVWNDGREEEEIRTKEIVPTDLAKPTPSGSAVQGKEASEPPIESEKSSAGPVPKIEPSLRKLVETVAANHGRGLPNEAPPVPAAKANAPEPEGKKTMPPVPLTPASPESGSDLRPANSAHEKKSEEGTTQISGTMAHRHDDLRGDRNGATKPDGSGRTVVPSTEEKTLERIVVKRAEEETPSPAPKPSPGSNEVDTSEQKVSGGFPTNDREELTALKTRHFEIMPLEQLQDRESTWHPVDRYRAYLSAYHSYYGWKDPAELFPLWVYEGELAPQFLDQQKAWKFYDRLPMVHVELATLPPPVAKFVAHYRGSMQATERAALQAEAKALPTIKPVDRAQHGATASTAHRRQKEPTPVVPRRHAAFWRNWLHVLRRLWFWRK
jgi:hypothetical protein